ncbi:Intradiol ring-cleavage dioxygenase [Fusarium flagelliforme]|uniref:Intradiol ring-cleavage dioxygenase n=1 Tax=Fusarium flagelliforme TaxID=2675880 RepID=UPI001E8E5E6A|nr:Intradiol ring-cleavage dioxygenase [Fusarium flagelliforme]KAH7193921.1 Intradiol ring-cleavage dioxygenase [Fusarium flagelliforme]
MVPLKTLVSAGLLLANIASAHPGEKHDHQQIKRQIQARDTIANLGQRSLNACSGSDHALALKSRSISRRARKVQELREKLGIKTAPRKHRRDEDDIVVWEGVNHNQTGISSNNMFTPLETVFGANSSCILSPEVTAGPYYIVGEYLRSNVIEKEHCDGVPLFLEVQYVDVSTCGAVPNLATDVWNCNATGVYSGVSSQAGINTTFLRGIQITDNEGVVQFETIFPGHYEGRATHTHLLTHANASVSPNGTIQVWNSPVSHIGQLFWPEDLRKEVEANAPYNTNDVEVTTNEEDMWSVLQADESYDPFPQYVYLGDTVEQGIFAWIQIGINVTADHSSDEYYGVAGYLDSEGGHALDSGIGGGDGGQGGSPPGGSGTPPAGQPTAAPSS